jgi:hypothetical protein
MGLSTGRGRTKEQSSTTCPPKNASIAEASARTRRGSTRSTRARSLLRSDFAARGCERPASELAGGHPLASQPVLARHASPDLLSGIRPHGNSPDLVGAGVVRARQRRPHAHLASRASFRGPWGVPPSPRLTSIELTCPTRLEGVRPPALHLSRYAPRLDGRPARFSDPRALALVMCSSRRRRAPRYGRTAAPKA